MADLSLRLISEASETVGYFKRHDVRCTNCGAPWNRADRCEYCDAKYLIDVHPDLRHRATGSEYIIPRSRLPRPLPEPSDGKVRQE
jgi:hypothetical protein